MVRTMDALAPFHADESRSFFDYWQGLPRHGRVVPDRKDFDPLAIRRLMPMTVMVEYDGLEAATFRFAGSKLVEILGFDPTKKKYLDLLEEQALGGFMAASEPLITIPCGGSFPVTVQAATGYTLKCEALDQPLYNEKARSWIVLALISVMEISGMHGKNDFKILEIGKGRWIDLGAGIPES